MAEQIPGLHLRRGVFAATCTKKQPCPLRTPGVLALPCLKCALAEIDKEAWLHDGHTCTGKECTPEHVVATGVANTLMRRTQHYGYEYNHGHKNKPLAKCQPLTSNRAVAMFAEVLSDNFDNGPTQCIVNEYRATQGSRGQGIAAHSDNLCFGPIIISLALTGSCSMDLVLPRRTESLLLEPGDVLLLEEDARYVYKHGIKGVRRRDVDPTDPRRVSLTYRTLA